mgnify:CR=1 FL=1
MHDTVSAAELAELLGVSRMTLHRMARSGLLRVTFRRGPVPREEVEAYTERAKAEAERVITSHGVPSMRYRVKR